MIRVLLIPSSDYLGHPFPQRHNQIFERVHDGRDYEVHVVRFNIFNKAKLPTKCVVHDLPLEFSAESTPLYYLSNAIMHVVEILRIVRQESINVVVAGNILPPLLFGLVKELSRMRLPFIFDLQDYYPASATGYVCDLDGAFGVTIRGFFERVTATLLRMADAVTVPGVALAGYAKKVLGVNSRQQVYMVPNGISEHFLKKNDGRSIRKVLGCGEGSLVIGYVGSVEFWLDMRPLIRAVAEAYRQGVNVRFMLVGGRLQTTYAEKVLDWIRHEGIEQITDYVGFVAHERVPEYVAAMDFGVIPFDVRNQVAYYAAPNKLWEYLSQGVSVISTPIPEALAYKHLINIVRSENDYISILKNAGKICRERQEEEIRRHVENRTWNKSAERFKEIISNLVWFKR
ncbi:MAG: glycosyltransferase [Candidatus Bathyarchaeia archaeon]